MPASPTLRRGGPSSQLLRRGGDPTLSGDGIREGPRSVPDSRAHGSLWPPQGPQVQSMRFKRWAFESTPQPTGSGLASPTSRGEG